MTSKNLTESALDGLGLLEAHHFFANGALTVNQDGGGQSFYPYRCTSIPFTSNG